MVEGRMGDRGVKRKPHMRKYIGFGLVMLASSAMNNLFVTYYLDVFLNVVKLDATAFYVGQLVFMTWNALNDPLFGWISDHAKLPFLKASNRNIVSRRLAVIKYGGVLWAVAFFLVWTPPSEPTAFGGFLYFTFALCFYDGMLTLVEVNHSALLADISTSSTERAKLNAYSAVCAGLGSLSSFFGHLMYDRSDAASLSSFQFLTFTIAVLCALVFFVACNAMESVTNSHHRFAITQQEEEESLQCNACGPGTQNLANIQESRKSVKKAEEGTGFLAFLSQLSQQRNFWLFQGFYFIQAFDCTFEKNHFSIFLDGLAGDSFSGGILGLIISASFILPWVGTVFFTPLVQRHGLFWVVKSILSARLAWCGLSLVMSRYATAWFAAFFLLSNRVMSEAVCRICPLIISDLVDEDSYIHRRTESISATIVGASTLMGKGSQSLAPMLGFFMLNNGLISAEWKHLMLFVLVSVPLCCVVLQFTLWSFFTLQGAYLKRVKDYSTMQDSKV